MPLKITLDDLKKTQGIGENKRMLEQLSTDGSIESAINEEERTIWFIAVSENNAGIRETWSGIRYIEEIDVSSIDDTNLRLFIKDHTPSSDNAVGKVIQTLKEDGRFKVQVKFATTQDADTIFRKFVEGILTDVSIGYRYDIGEADIFEPDGAEMPYVRLKNVQIYELSSVWMGFDKEAKMGREANSKVEDLPTKSGLRAEVVSERMKLMIMKTQI